MTSTDVTVRRSVTDPIASLCDGLYEATFGEESRVDPTVLDASVADGTRQAWVAEVGSKPVGFAVTLRLGPATTLLEYLAVDPPSRSRGVGGVLYDGVWDATRPHSRLLYVEIEDPADPAATDPDQRARRHAFYRRHHTDLTPGAITYTPPSLGGGANHPYLLLARWEGEPPSLLDDAEALAAIATDSYGLRRPQSAG